MYAPSDESRKSTEPIRPPAPGSAPQDVEGPSASDQVLRGARLPSAAGFKAEHVGPSITTSAEFAKLSPEKKSAILTESLADCEAADRAVDALVSACSPALAKQRSWFALVSAAQSFITPFLTSMLTGGGMSAVVGVVGSMGSSMVFSCLNVAKSRISAQLDNLVFAKQLSIATGQIYGISYHDRNEAAVTNEISQIKSNQSTVSEFISLRYTILEAWGSAAGALASMCWGGWHNVGAAALVAAGALVSRRIERRKKELNKVLEREKGAPSSKIFAPASSFTDGKTADQLCTMGREKFPEGYIQREGEALTKVFNDFVAGFSKLAFQNWFVNAATCSAAGGYLLWQLGQGAVGVESVVQFAAAVVGFQGALSTLIENSGRRERGAVGANRALDLAGHWRRVSGGEEPTTKERTDCIRRELREKGFSFHLQNIKVEKTCAEGTKTILDIQDPVEIRAGELVGIVGETGSGKTTFMRVLLGIEKPTQGEVEVRIGEGADAEIVRMSEIPLAALHGEIGYAPQDGYDGNGLEVEEFLSLGANSEDEKRLTLSEAIEKVGADFLYEHLKQRIGNSWTPSGGQRVLMRIVQSLLGGRPMHILDEPLTGLDTTTKEKIVTLIRRAKGEKTQLYITHDFSGLGSADKLIVIEKGKPVVVGTPDELLVKPGHYRALWETNEKLSHKPPRKGAVTGES